MEQDLSDIRQFFRVGGIYEEDFFIRDIAFDDLGVFSSLAENLSSSS